MVAGARERGNCEQLLDGYRVSFRVLKCLELDGHGSNTD